MFALKLAAATAVVSLTRALVQVQRAQQLSGVRKTVEAEFEREAGGPDCAGNRSQAAGQAGSCAAADGRPPQGELGGHALFPRGGDNISAPLPECLCCKQRRSEILLLVADVSSAIEEATSHLGVSTLLLPETLILGFKANSRLTRPRQLQSPLVCCNI